MQGNHAVHDESVDPLTAILIGRSRRQMLLALAESPSSARGLSSSTNVSVAEAASYLVELETAGLASVALKNGEAIYSITPSLTIAREGGRVRIRAQNDAGDFAQVTYRE